MPVSPISPPSAEDLRYLEHSLQGVSRTFALTIPTLPESLRAVVGNAYLLCRIADTIEDEATLPPDEKRRFSEAFVAVVAGEAAADGFAQALHPLLSRGTLASERDLVCNTPAVIRITRSFNPAQQAALERCVRIMATGMAEFQQRRTLLGLDDMAHMDRYCYYVAGVVGEMLTDLFCDYSTEIADKHDTLLRLGVSFGQGLQMTNILKDIWEDRQRGACWLPRDVFARHGFDLGVLSPGQDSPAFAAALRELIGIAVSHLRNALEYTLLLPRHEEGLRRFCLWAVGMAVLTLRNIDRQPHFDSGRSVKITRREVRTTVWLTSLAVRRDSVLRLFFESLARRLPPAPAGAGVELAS